MYGPPSAGQPGTVGVSSYGSAAVPSYQPPYFETSQPQYQPVSRSMPNIKQEIVISSD